MTIIARPHRKVEIDLMGPEGNAWVLMGKVRTFGSQLGMTLQQMDDITAEMRQGDYENLINVFDRNFGHLVDLIHDSKDY